MTEVRLIKFPISKETFGGVEIPEGRVPAELAQLACGAINSKWPGNLTVDKLAQEGLTWSQLVSLLYSAGLKDKVIERNRILR